MSLRQQFSLLPNIEALWNFSCAVQKGGAPSSIFVVRKTAKRHKKAPTDTYGIGLGWAGDFITILCHFIVVYDKKCLLCAVREDLNPPTLLDDVPFDPLQFARKEINFERVY